MEVRCALADETAEHAYEAFRDGICGGKARRYAMLYRSADGVRCKLENSGRCLNPDTPWHMVRFLVEPLFRFDPTIEWVALFPAEDWRRRLDRALQEEMDGGGPWTRIVANHLAAELADMPRLVITR